MKAKDLIKILEAHPEADILIEDAEYLHPVLADVYRWEYISTYPEMPDETLGFVFAPKAHLDGVNAFEDFVTRDED